MPAMNNRTCAQCSGAFEHTPNWPFTVQVSGKTLFFDSYSCQEIYKRDQRRKKAGFDAALQAAGSE